MNSPRFFRTISIGLALVSMSCIDQPKTPECGDIPSPPGPNAFITKMNGQPLPNQSSTDIPIQRQNSASLDITLEYSVQRTWTKCGGSYTGPLTINYFELTQGVTAVFNPQTIPESHGSPQTIQILLHIPAQVMDGKIPLRFQSPDVHYFNPDYNILLTTKP